MARLPRYAAPGMPHHVIQRGNNRSAFFATDDDYHFFRACLAAACDRFGCQVHTYVLMTNHVHLLLTPANEGAVGKVMQAVGRRYVQHFNDTYQRTGALWEGRYRATLVDTEAYLFTCSRYIELNPVRAGLVRQPADYRWSSYAANALGARDSLVTPHPAYSALGADVNTRLAAYVALFGEPLPDATLDAIRDATNRGWVLGSKRFRDEIATLLRRRTQRRRGGRTSALK